MFNLFVAKLSEVRDREGRILKKQLKLIGLLSLNYAMFLKAKGNSLKWKELKYWKNLWWKSFTRIHKNDIQWQKIPKCLSKANQGKISLTIIYSYFLSINLNNKAIWKDPSSAGKTALLEGT